VNDTSPRPRRLASSVVDASSMETFKYVLLIKLSSYIQSVLLCNHDSDLLCWHYFSQVYTNIGRFTAVLSLFKPAKYSCVCLSKEFLVSYRSNICAVQVFDDVAVELTMALLQYFNSNPPEEHLFRCMKALNRFCQISQQDVPQLIQMIGPEPAKFRGASARVDDLITQISKRLR